MEGKYGLGEETVFEFKYVPDFHVTTEKGDDSMVGVRGPGVERRNFVSFMLALSCMSGVAYGGFWLVSGMFSRVTSLLF